MEDKNCFLDSLPIPDLTDAEEVRKAIISSEILSRKY